MKRKKKVRKKSILPTKSKAKAEVMAKARAKTKAKTKARTRKKAGGRAKKAKAKAKARPRTMTAGMKRIRLELPAGRRRSYPIVVGRDALREIAGLTAGLGMSAAFIVGDRQLEKTVTELAGRLARTGVPVYRHLVTASEAAKDYRQLFRIFSQLIASNLDRDAVVFAVGGGVVGDLTGFVASSFLRGVRWVGVPTTLLAQVDSSVGGKTGVNHPLGKNLIGSFHQPELVICDTSVLGSLSERDRLSGLGEIIKYALAFDPSLWSWVKAQWRRVMALENEPIQTAVSRSLEWKSRIVGKDERETRGLRRTLNFGHTLGHALESLTAYRKFRHGEAVIVGMRLAAALSVQRGHLDESSYREIDEFLGMLPVPAVPHFPLSSWLELVRRDKKASGGKVAFVCLRAIGETVSDNEVRPADIASAFQRAGIPLGGK